MVKRSVRWPRRWEEDQGTSRDRYYAFRATWSIEARRINHDKSKSEEVTMQKRRSLGGGVRARAAARERAALPGYGGVPDHPAERCDRHDDERQAMVKATAESFVRFYNRQHGSRYELADRHASYVRCVDKNTLNTLNLEIRVIEDAPGGEGQGHWIGAPGDAVGMLIEGLRSEIATRPRADTALVVRQSAAIWSREEWTRYLSKIPWSRIGLRGEVFDRGIWVLYSNEVKAVPSGLGEGAEFLRVDPYRPTRKPPIRIRLTGRPGATDVGRRRRER